MHAHVCVHMKVLEWENQTGRRREEGKRREYAEGQLNIRVT